MCQVSVVLDQDGRQEKIMENVTLLLVEAEGVRISTFFEEPRFIDGGQVSRIDFLNNTVTLTAPAKDK